MGNVSFLKARPNVVSNDKATVHTSNSQGSSKVVNDRATWGAKMTTPFINKAVTSVMPGKTNVNRANTQGGDTHVDNSAKRKFKGATGIVYKRSSTGNAGNNATKNGAKQTLNLDGAKGIKGLATPMMNGGY